MDSDNTTQVMIEKKLLRRDAIRVEYFIDRDSMSHFLYFCK